MAMAATTSCGEAIVARSPNWLGQPNGGFAGNFSNAYGVVDNSWQVHPTSEMLI